MWDPEWDLPDLKGLDSCSYQAANHRDDHGRPLALGVDGARFLREESYRHVDEGGEKLHRLFLFEAAAHQEYDISIYCPSSI